MPLTPMSPRPISRGSIWKHKRTGQEYRVMRVPSNGWETYHLRSKAGDLELHEDYIFQRFEIVQQ